MGERPARGVVIGIGNPDRGDDGLGRAVARRLAGALPAGVALVEETGEAARLVSRLQAADAAILVDASASGAAPGTIRCLDVAASPLPAGLFALTTHGVGLAEAIELARALGTLPPRCTVYAIEGEAFGLGAPLSPAVAAAVVDVAARIAAETATWQERPAVPSR
jgi:hydrogenase maturation protease